MSSKTTHLLPLHTPYQGTLKINADERGCSCCLQEQAGEAKSFRLCLNNFLTLHNLEGRALVNSLVTKPKYSSKPASQNYDIAFHRLITDFKDRCFQKLVCSPMGCVND